MTIAGARASDRTLLRRAARSSALLTAAAVTVVVAVVGVLAYFLAARELNHRDHDLVRQAAVSADDVGDPPAGVILLYAGSQGRTLHSDNTPRDLQQLDVRGMPLGSVTVDGNGRHFLGYVSQRDTGSRFLALLSPEQEVEPSRLLVPVLLAGAAGIVGAAVVGGILGRRSAQPLGRALALQRNFVADASHELRAPLTLLHTRAQLLERSLRDGPDSDLATDAADLVTDARILDEVVRDLLLSAEFEHQPERSDVVDLAELARQVAAEFRIRAVELHVELAVAVASAEPMAVRGARTALRRAISSLVDNALSHSRPDGHVRLTVSRAVDEVALAVSDDGDGLDPAETRALLQRFARGNAAPGHGRRFGLGLALVNQIINAHHGSLIIDGRPGAGAVFTMRLPAAG